MLQPQAEARQRSINYFAIREIVRNDAEAQEAWRRLRSLDIDPAIRLHASIVSQVLGRLDIDETGFQKVHDGVQHGYERLEDGDLVLELGFAGYPRRLAETQDAPTFLFVRQGEDCLNTAGLAIVGTREASDDGKKRAFKLAYLLARRNLVVISGLARGIDTAAHIGALEPGGLTAAVIGTPITRTYPKENAALQEAISRTGALISQFHPRSNAGKFAFPMRNATMSGLALGTVVIEASETSGALVQARKALQQGRKLFIPQSAIDNEALTWPRTYRERGAHVFKTIEDLVEVLEDSDLIPPGSGETRDGSVETQLLRAYAG